MSLLTNVDQIILTYGNEEFLKKFAKKGSETDIRYYNQRLNGANITYLNPFKFPERIQPLLNAASVSKKAIISVENLDKNVGELLLAIDYSEIKHLGVISNEEVYENLKKITKGIDVSVTLLQEDLGSIENFISTDVTERNGNAMVTVDQSFQVKGVGTVILGFVIQGEIKKHMNLKAYPSGKNVEIRSIQIMDVDYESAKPFSRVGLAVKNVEPEDVSKGTLLFDADEMEMSDSIRMKVRINGAIKNKPQLGEKIQVNFLFNNINAEISDVSEESYLIDTDKKIPIIATNYIISSLNSLPRISGVGKAEY